MKAVQVWDCVRGNKSEALYFPLPFRVESPPKKTLLLLSPPTFTFAEVAAIRKTIMKGVMKRGKEKTVPPPFLLFFFSKKGVKGLLRPVYPP